jgi:hypothetical protein
MTAFEGKAEVKCVGPFGLLLMMWTAPHAASKCHKVIVEDVSH